MRRNGVGSSDCGARAPHSRGVTHAAPRLDRLRRQEPALPDRRRRERDAAELRDAAGLEALQLAVIER